MRFMAATAIFALLSACSVNPVTGEKELTLMSASQEVATGEQNYELYQQQQGGRYVVDPNLQQYVSEVGQKLAAVSDRQLPYEFVVLNSSVPNAWALPGGKIAINRGLLSILDDEAQLAAVLGHEIVHAAARHSARQMTQATLMQAGVMAAGIASQSTNYGQYITMGAGLGANLWQAHYGRDQELEADRYGVEYMHKAGYDAAGAVELQQKFLELSQSQQSNFFNDLFASHPPSQVRVERNRELASQFTGGTRNKSSFQQATRQLRRDEPAYQAHQNAVAAAQQNDLAGAKSHLQKAIELQPQEPLFYITRGQLQMAESDHKGAADAFRQAVRYNPEYYVGHLGLGLALKEQKQLNPARDALNKSMEVLATPIASYHLGEISLASGNQAQAREYFTFAAEASGQVGEAARAQLAKLEN